MSPCSDLLFVYSDLVQGFSLWPSRLSCPPNHLGFFFSSLPHESVIPHVALLVHLYATVLRCRLTSSKFLGHFDYSPFTRRGSGANGHSVPAQHGGIQGENTSLPERVGQRSLGVSISDSRKPRNVCHTGAKGENVSCLTAASAKGEKASLLLVLEKSRLASVSGTWRKRGFFFFLNCQHSGMEIFPLTRAHSRMGQEGFP